MSHPPIRRGHILSEIAWKWVDAGLAGIGLAVFIVVLCHLGLIIGEHPFP